jgi:hypothetical protein
MQIPRSELGFCAARERTIFNIRMYNTTRHEMKEAGCLILDWIGLGWLDLDGRFIHSTEALIADRPDTGRKERLDRQTERDFR